MRKAASIVLNGIMGFIIALAIVIALINLGVLSQGSLHTSFEEG